MYSDNRFRIGGPGWVTIADNAMFAFSNLQYSHARGEWDKIKAKELCLATKGWRQSLQKIIQYVAHSSGIVKHCHFMRNLLAINHPTPGLLY